MHALAQLCIRRPVFATMLIMSLVVVGIFSYFSLGVDLFPKVDIPTVLITVANPGASPEEVETEITRKVEDAVNTISQIDEVRSISSEGLSTVVMQFELSKDGNVAAQEVQTKVNLIANNLPETAKQPIIQKFDPDAAPVMQIAISAPRPLRDLTAIADKLIKQKLENSKGVGEIRIIGGARREIHIEVDPQRLRAWGLTINDVFNAARTQNLELPAGNLREGAREFTVRTTGRISDPVDFNQMTIANRGSYVVKVSDIGRAEDSYEEPRTAARLDGTPSVTLLVAKQSGVNSVSTAAGVKERLKEIQLTLPKDVKTSIVADQSVFIEAAISNINHHLILGSLLASGIIFIFLANWRTTLIASIAIPTSIISAFALMAAMGLTLNQITMLSLTLMVGIVIDDAIIVLENIFRFMEEKGMGPVEAAIKGTQEIGLAVMATTLSPARGLPARGLHGRHRRPLYEFVRLHRGLRHRGVAARFLYADPDADVEICAGQSGRALFEEQSLLRVARYALHLDADVGHGAPQNDAGLQRSHHPQHRAAVHDGRQELSAHR